MYFINRHFAMEELIGLRNFNNTTFTKRYQDHAHTTIVHVRVSEEILQGNVTRTPFGLSK